MISQSLDELSAVVAPPPANCRTVSGISSSDEAKIGGMTPAVLSLSGRWLRSCCIMPRAVWRLGYWIRTRRWARSMKQMNRTRTTTAMTMPNTIERVHRAGAAALEQLGQRLRHRGDDAGHDDQRHAVADAAAGDLLADPHQEQGAADQADRRGDAEQHARLDHRGDALGRRPAFQADGDEIALHGGQQDGQVAGVLVELLAPDLAFLLERLPRLVERGAELNDDRGGDVGHHAERDDRHALQAAAREGVEEVEHPALLRLEQGRQRARIDAGNGNERQQAEQHQRAEGEPQALLELGRLGEARQRNIGGQLFGCGCHR